MRTILSLTLILAMTAAAAAQDLVPVNGKRGQKPIRLKKNSLHVVIKDQVAEVTMSPTFHNPNGQDINGMFFTHLPAGAQVQQFKIKVDGKEITGELLDANKARQVFSQMVAKRGDPAILELVGEQMLRAQITPVKALSSVKVEITYTQLLESEQGLVRFSAPFARQVTNRTKIDHADLVVKIQSKAGIKAVYSPTHSIDVAKKDDHNVLVAYEATNYSPDRDLNLFYTVMDKEIGVSLLTYKQGKEDGFFALLVSPKVEVEEKKMIPKDVVFVMDRSGSMSGEKIRQARNSLRFCIERLKPTDRFNIIDFSTTAESFEEELVEATKENVARARRYIVGLEAAGSTNIDGALKMATGMMKADPARVSMVFFATDGLPTAGTQNLDKILGNVKERNKGGKLGRVFVFGVGNDVNTLFLDRLAQQTRGARDYVQPEEDIETKVASLYRKVSSPILSGIALDFGDVDTMQVYPRELPDVFKGSQLVVFGRYEKGGKAVLRLTGSAGGEKRTMEYEVDFPEKQTRDDFLPKLWAGRKIAYIMDNIRMSGRADKELIDEIVRLGKRYGIVTAYTSFLITDEGSAYGRGGGKGDDRLARKLEEKAKKMHDKAANSGSPSKPGASKEAQEESKDLKKAADSDDMEALDGFAEQASSEARRRGQNVTEVRSIANKTFYRRGGPWIDGEYSEKEHKEKLVKVEFLSEAYFKLIDENTGIQKYLSLGDRMYIVYGGQVYHIAPKEAEKEDPKKDK